VQEPRPRRWPRALARVCGPLDEELAELGETTLAEPRQVDHSAERVQRLGGADVVGRPLAADVLLARLEGEDEATPPIDVLGLPAIRPGIRRMLLGRAEEPERGPAVVETAAERLTLPATSAPHSPGGFRIDRAIGRRRRPPARHAPSPSRPAPDVLDGPQEVRLLQEDGRGLVVDRLGEGRGVGDAVDNRSLDQLRAVPGPVGDQRLTAVDGRRAGDQLPPPGRPNRQEGRRRDGGRTSYRAAFETGGR
jgi:hypothetical protein